MTLDSLPRNRAGKVDRSRLPRPAAGPGTSSPSFGAAKSAFGSEHPDQWSSPGFTGWAVTTVIFGLGGLLATAVLWRGATDLTGVPQPWAVLFFLLYAFEIVAFGVGGAFLFLGGELLRRMGGPKVLARAAHLATGWLLIAWLPQDNLYRLASKTDWPRQAVLVYTFNITLMIAGAVVAAFVVRTFAATLRASEDGLAGRPRTIEDIRQSGVCPTDELLRRVEARDRPGR